MAETSVIRGGISFLEKIGIYDVVLPFLLVFSISFAILEKTKVLGTDDYGGDKIPKKNINAIVAFVLAFLVVASSKLVQFLTTVSSQIVIVLVIIMLFLTLVASFQKESDDGIGLEKKWKTGFMIIVLISVTLITFNALKTDSGESWLMHGMKFVVRYWSTNVFAAFVFLLGLVGFIMFLTNPSGNTGSDDTE